MNRPKNEIPHTRATETANLYMMTTIDKTSLVDHFVAIGKHLYGERVAPVPASRPSRPASAEDASATESPQLPRPASAQTAAVDTSGDDATATESCQSPRPASVQGNGDIEEDDDASIPNFNSAVDNDDESITSESPTFRSAGRDASTNTESPFDEIDRDPSPVNVMDVPNTSHRQLFEEEQLGLLREQRELAREQRRVTQLQGNVLERQSNQEDLTRRVNLRAREKYEDNRPMKRKYMNNPDMVQRIVRTMPDDSKAPKGMSQEVLEEWEDCFSDD